jgi:hypothetical protein
VTLTSIRTSCIDCGDVELSIDDIALELPDAGGEGRYRFNCPSCGATYHRPASAKVIEALLAIGAAWHPRSEASPITDTEIAEFVATLDTDDWLGEITSPDEGSPGA